MSQNKNQDEYVAKKIKIEEADNMAIDGEQQSNRIRLADGIALCVSSIPGAQYGACVTQNIPIGTWFGPFEGKLVRTNENLQGPLSEFMWEVIART